MNFDKLSYQNQQAQLPEGDAPGLPKGWEIMKLGEIGKVCMCKRILKKQTLPVGDIPFYKIGTFGKTANAFISNQVYQEYRSKYSFPKKGDILISASGTIGRRVIYDGQPAYFQDSNIVWIDNDEKEVLNSFLYKFYGFCNWNPSKGATISRLYNDDLRNIEIPIPPLPEQQRIVSILDECFDAIDKAKVNAGQNLKNARELFESYLQGVFGGSTGSPTEKKGDGWEKKRLGEVCKIKPPKKEAKEKLNETDKVSFIPMEDLGVCENEIKPVKERELKDVSGSYTYFAENDVLLAKITPCFENGKLGIAKNLKNSIGFGSSEYIVFRCSEEVIPELLFYYLARESFRKEGQEYMGGAVGHKRVSKDWIENYLFSFPKSLEEQQTIVRQLDALRAETQKLEAVYQKKIADLEELKKSILQKAFAGDLPDRQAGLKTSASSVPVEYEINDNLSQAAEPTNER